MMGEYDAGYENYIDGLHREIIDYQIEVEQVKGENAKLRELVRDMQHAIACLVVLGDDYAGEHEDELCALDDRMRELGVEVVE